MAALFAKDVSVEVLKKKYAHPESKFIDVKGHEVHYRDEGNPSDECPLVLVHGTAVSLQTWDDCTTEWIKDRRVIRMDIPAFGLTGPNKEDSYTLEIYRVFIKKLFGCIRR